jgi:Domain of unknown function (DUF1707)
MIAHPMLRASDSDREAVAERLRLATAEGRLTPEELDDRLQALFASRTYGELEPLVADLPEPESAASDDSDGVSAPVWVAVTISGALFFAIVGLLARGHSASGVVAQRGAGAPPHVFVTGSPAAPAAMLLVLVLAASLCAAAGWAYSRVADRARRRLSS